MFSIKAKINPICILIKQNIYTHIYKHIEKENALMASSP